MNCGQINRFTHSTCLTFAVDFIVSIDIIKSHNEKMKIICIRYIHQQVDYIKKQLELNTVFACLKTIFGH